MEKFTKGAWLVGPNEHDGVKYSIPVTSQSERSLVCHCYGTTTPMADWYAGAFSVKSNAHLIAAAPEMYEMLAKLSGMLTDINAHNVVNEIEKLLAKARGE